MKKIIRFFYTIIPLIIIGFLGYKYIKNPNIFLRKKDIDKAKEKIKAAKQLNLNSKKLRQKINNEVTKIKVKASVRLSDLNTSIDDVKKLEDINKSIEALQKAREVIASKLLKGDK